MCGDCQITFEYPSRLRQHLSTQQHQLYAIHSTELKREGVTDGGSDSEDNDYMYDQDYEQDEQDYEQDEQDYEQDEQDYEQDEQDYEQDEQDYEQDEQDYEQNKQNYEENSEQEDGNNQCYDNDCNDDYEYQIQVCIMEPTCEHHIH